MDEYSYAEYAQVRVTHTKLDLQADFGAKRLKGFVELTLDWKSPDAKILDLDTRDLAISKVERLTAKVAWRKADYRLDERHAVKGQRLRVELPEQATKVRIHYATAPDASGLQWLSPEQTAGKKRPFMFSQSQAIHARSWVPLQDTPAVRFTYEARIRAPEGLRAVMSANNDAAASADGDFHFKMEQAIPSYLMAIAIGELDYREIGPRSGVYAEPSRLAAAAEEFADTEAMIVRAEALYGPYRWGRYDLLVLPPSFPYGGMENPRLTFVTPTVIVGDKSLVALIAHELAHSWSGNLVTNSGWQHFWLNEGFTTYVENRLVEAIYGKDIAIIQQQLEQAELKQDFADFAPKYQALVPQLDGIDPDEVFSGIPYAKGAWFLRTIEKRVGRAAFDEFLRTWFDRNAFKSVDTDDFITFLQANLLREHPDAMPKAELEQWLHQPGLPASAEAVSSPALAKIDAALKKWLDKKLDAEALQAKAWSTQEWVRFLSGIEAVFGAVKSASGDPHAAYVKVVGRGKLAMLDQAYGLTAAKNSEIAFHWFMIAIAAGYEPAYVDLKRFLTNVGRRKFIQPLYKQLAKFPERKKWAVAVYAEAKAGYHPVTRSAAELALGLR